MGREVLKLCMDGYGGAEAVAGVDVNADATCPVPCAAKFEDIQCAADCIVDFSHHSSTMQLLDYACAAKLPVVIATTGQTEEEMQRIQEAAKEIPVFLAANFSMGIAVLRELVQKTVAAFPDADVEIIEQHHNRKLDAPSGTAMSIAEAIKQVRTNAVFQLGRSGMQKRQKNEVGIHAVRMGNVVGIHEVLISTANQTITLKHEAHSRALFAEGALTAAGFLVNRPAGLYDMNSLLSIL